MTSILIDLGHGGNDPGAVSSGVREKDIVLKIGLKLQSLLNKYSLVYGYTRTSDKSLSLRERTNMSKNYDWLVSIHINSSVNQNANGFQTYIYTNPGAKATNLANNVQGEFNKIFPVTKWTRVEKKNLHMLRESPCPAILVECGFLSNSNDRKKLLDDKHLDKIAQSIMNGLVKTLGLKPKTISQPVKVSPSQPTKKKYTSIVEYLKAHGVDSSFANRKKIAIKIGIKNYTGTASQNIQMLNYYQG